jgi:hypothetical protein
VRLQVTSPHFALIRDSTACPAAGGAADRADQVGSRLAARPPRTLRISDSSARLAALRARHLRLGAVTRPRTPGGFASHCAGRSAGRASRCLGSRAFGFMGSARLTRASPRGWLATDSLGPLGSNFAAAPRTAGSADGAPRSPSSSRGRHAAPNPRRLRLALRGTERPARHVLCSWSGAPSCM